MSNSVVVAMEQQGYDSTKSTRKLFSFMNRFFDILNVRTPVEGVHQQKNDLKPFKEGADQRLKVVYSKWFFSFSKNFA